MVRRVGAPMLLFYSLTAFMVVVSTISFIASLSWINKPFPGFLIYHCPYVGSMSISDWPGRQAGLKFLDQVMSMDGGPVWKGRDVYRLAAELPLDSQSSFLVKSKGEIREVILPIVRFTLRDYLMTFLFTFLGGVAVLALGFVVFMLKPGTRTSWVFFVFCFFLSLYMVTSFEILTTYFFIYVHYFAISMMAAAVFHLGLVFPERKWIVARYPALEYLVYVPALVFSIGYEIYFSQMELILKANALQWMPDYKTLGTVTRIYSLGCALGLIVFVVHALFRASSVGARQRARMILFGVTIAFLPPALVMMGFFLFKVNFPWNFLVFFVIFFPAAIAYSIARHNLFDADVIIRRTVGYAVMTAILIGLYVGVTLSLNLFVGKYRLAQSQAFPILFTLGIILIFNPLRNRVQSLVDRLFFRKEYDYGAVVDRVGRAMTSLLDQGQILRRLVQTFMEDLFVGTSSIMLLDTGSGQYRVRLADGEQKEPLAEKGFRRDEALIRVIEGSKRELTKYDVLEDPKYAEISRECASGFDAVHASLMVPLVFQDQVIGIVSLGEKKSGKAYNRQDLDLLHAVANQGAVAIENARLFQENLEKQRMEEELNIARDLQMSMLPSACPEIRGFEIAASSMPAREVGGDFYDFIEMGEEKAGLVIADVTGKSVSGALVMAASRTAFRMLSEEKLDVGEIMVRANRRIKKDIKTGMFVALLYAVLDAGARKVSLCSAGQTQPIHFSAKTGRASLIETQGDNFPLGILEDADYEETQLSLSPGDTVVFYTDGIVEAMNENDEMFGFDRLLSVVAKSGAMAAKALHQEILDRVGEFVGKAPQHDDLTVIVLSAGD